MSAMYDEIIIQKPEAGILIRGTSKSVLNKTLQDVNEKACLLGIDQLIEMINGNDDNCIRLKLNTAASCKAPSPYDTLQLCAAYNLHPQTNVPDLEKEILLSMLSDPVTFEYPNYSEFESSVKIRCNIVEAARRTALAFHTSKIERPTDYWTYSEDCGFTVLSGKSLIDALRKASQPEASGEKYSFSCYRATEYVILLGIAQELANCNSLLLQQLQQQWESRAIMSRQFHEIFLQEYGSMYEPLPYNYYVPGDRLWFRNPDPVSAEVTGFEGSWVFYLGGGLFSNFWERNKPYTLAAKCIEIYHWRHGVFKDNEGNLQMNEAIVKGLVRATMQNTDERDRILELMLRLRDPQEIHAEGGCIDASREYPRWVCPASADLILPNILST